MSEKRHIYFQMIRQYFLRYWDPIGINNEPAAQDEYDDYIEEMYTKLIQSRSGEEIRNYLWHVETQLMGLPGDKARLDQVVERLQEIPERVDEMLKGASGWKTALKNVPWWYVVGGYMYSCLLAGVFPELMCNWKFVLVNCLVLAVFLPVRKVVAFGMGQMVRILVLFGFMAYAWQGDKDIGEDDWLKFAWVGSEIGYVLSVAEEYREQPQAKQKLVATYPYPFCFLRHMDFE